MKRKNIIFYSAIFLLIIFSTGMIIHFKYKTRKKVIPISYNPYLDPKKMTFPRDIKGNERYQVIADYIADKEILKLSEKCPTNNELKKLIELNLSIMTKRCIVNEKDYEIKSAIFGILTTLYKSCEDTKVPILNNMNEIYKNLPPNDKNDHCSSLSFLDTHIGYEQIYDFETKEYWRAVAKLRIDWRITMAIFSDNPRKDIEKGLKYLITEANLNPNKRKDIEMCLKNMELWKQGQPIIDNQWKYDWKKNNEPY